MKRLNYFDCEELAASMMGIEDQYENSDDPSYFVEEKLREKFDMEMDSFVKIVEHLLPMIDVGTSFTGARYKGFAKNGMFLVKQEITGNSRA